MTGSVVGLTMPFPNVGNIATVGPGPEIEARPVNSSSAAIPYGKAVILNSDNTVSLADATITAANFAGISVAEAHQPMTYPTSGPIAGSYAYPASCDFLKRGCIAVAVAHGTPTAGGAVYIRTVLNSSFPSEAIGDFRADADSGKTVQLTNCAWHTGKVDANNVSILKVKSINN